MNDLEILLIAIAAAAVFAGYLVAMRPGALMNLIELVTAVATAFLFVYLLWALLRPEDF